ncbi:hypothetical protein C789_3007 [Microcystis aeruginosa FACHB-905 = DIANCHI905]|uniref:Uncharacterized protein n=1 Tax=Microcystis aeruginosa PCC 7806SL TaxID=1903187 RepID=A0AB33BVI9_MICA7|nr:hypothetical protein BH695_0347 [Microcystis aeruginosa PCC 7806SL]ELS47173.1 hypothetical protein C789_3007 [Microcystis aeruginosa FACHB-905 = DIANCHI905]
MGGKFRDFFPENQVIDHLKMGKTPHPTPCPHEKLFQQPLFRNVTEKNKVLVVDAASQG